MPIRRKDLDEECWQCPQMQEFGEFCKCPFPDEDKKEEEEIEESNQKEAVYKWWKRLTDMRQYEIILTWYPTEVKEDTDIDKFFGDMPYKYQLEIYEGENEKKKKF